MASSLCRSIIKFDARKYEFDRIFMNLGTVWWINCLRSIDERAMKKFLLRDTTESLITQHESTGSHNTENKSIDKCAATMMISIDYRWGSISKCQCFTNEITISAHENEDMKRRRWNIILDFLACRTRRVNVDHLKTKFITEGKTDRESFSAGVLSFLLKFMLSSNSLQNYTNINGNGIHFLIGNGI